MARRSQGTPENRAVSAVADALKDSSQPEAEIQERELEPDAPIELPPPEAEIQLSGGDGETVTLSPELLNSLEGPGAMRPPPLSKEERKIEREKEREQQKLVSPYLKRLGALASKLPGAEHVKIHKREDTGQLAYVGTYTQRDLRSTKDIEEFIHTYLKPKWGPGEYIITAVDPHGRTLEAGSVVIAKPEEESTMSNGTSPMDVIKTLIDKSQSPAFGSRGAAPHVDPIEQMQKLEELRAKLGERAGAESGGMSTLVATIIQTSAQQNQMMIQMMQEQASRGEDRMMQLLAAMKPQAQQDNTTPILMMLLQKMFEQKTESSAPMPMPALPPPPDPLAQMEKMASIFAMLQPKEDKLTQYLLQNQVGFKEALELAKSNSPISAPGGLKESMEQVQMLLGLAMQLKQQQEPGASSGFWDAIHALVSNRGFGDGVAGFLKSRNAPQPQQLPSGNAVDMEVALNAQADRIKQQRILEARMRLEEEARLLQAGRQAPASLPASPPSNEASSAPATSVEAAAPSEADAATAKTIVPPASNPPKKRLAMPDGIEAPINAIVLAPTDEERVGAVIQLIEFFGAHEDWQKFSEAIFSAVANGDREKAMGYIKSMFEGLVAVQLLDVTIAQKAHDDFENNFENVSEYVQRVIEAEDEAEDGADEEDEPHEGSEEEDEEETASAES